MSKILARSAIAALVAAVAAYILQIVCRKRLGSLFTPTRVVICDRRYRVKHADNKAQCDCGGVFEDFDRWTWTDEVKEE
jgi:hypothetical protein